MIKMKYVNHKRRELEREGGTLRPPAGREVEGEEAEPILRDDLQGRKGVGSRARVAVRV